MSTSNPVLVPSDTRTRYTHQAYDVTYGGKSIESGPAGMGRRLSATYQANFQLSIDCSDTEPQVFTLPPYVYCNKLVVADGAGGGAAATISVAQPDGSLSEDIATALSLATASAADVPLDSNINAENNDQLVTVTVTTPGTGIANVLLKCDILQSAWK